MLVTLDGKVVIVQFLSAQGKQAQGHAQVMVTVIFMDTALVPKDGEVVIVQLLLTHPAHRVYGILT